MDSTGHEDELMAVPTVSERARQNLARVLGGRFRAGRLDVGNWPGAWVGGYEVSVPYSELPVPRLVQWVLQDFLGGEDTGREEKLAWQILFYFDNRRCALASQKFGLRLYVDGADLDEVEVRVLAKDVVRRLSSAIKVAARDVYATYAETQVRAGNVTVANKFHMLRRMYEHFRSLAEDPPDRLHEQRFFNAVAMVNSYFSLLEHTLVLAWPFVRYRPGVDDLERFIGHRWTEKFRGVFAINQDRTAKRHYDKLRGVADEYRNTYSHGGFDKSRGSFLIHMPGGAIPANVSDIGGRDQLDLFPITEPGLGQVVSVFDSVDTWLRTGPARYGLRYAEAGLDVPFSNTSVRNYQDAMRSDEDFSEYLTGLSMAIDNMINMDW